MVTRSRSLSNKFIKDKIHRASHIRPFPISTFSKTPLEKDEWDTFQEFYFRYPRLNSNKRVAMSRNPPQSHPPSCTISIRNVPDTGATDRHDPRRSQLFTTFARIPAWKHDPSKDERIYSTRRSCHRECQPSFEIFDWNRGERMRRFLPSPSYVRSVHPDFDYHFPVNGSDIRFPTCGVEFCVRYTYLCLKRSYKFIFNWWINSL